MLEDSRQADAIEITDAMIDAGNIVAESYIADEWSATPWELRKFILEKIFKAMQSPHSCSVSSFL